MPTTYFIMPSAVHDPLVAAAFQKRGFTPDESSAAARFTNMASRHGIRTHNAIKALHLDEHLGSGAGGCKPGAVPPFGNLFGLTVLVDEELAQREEIAFNAGSNTVSIVMRVADFLRLSGASVHRLSRA